MKSFLSWKAFWDPRGRTTRRAYARWGFGLMTLKLALDRLVALAVGADYFTWLNYWRPTLVWTPGGSAELPDYALPLLLLSLPFVVAGVMLTSRRLRDAGWPWWLVILFFVPAVNLVLFVALCLFPSRDQPQEPVAGNHRGVFAWLTRVLALKSAAHSAAVAMVLTTLMVVPLTWLATVFFESYGWSVFVALPFVLGLTSAVIFSAPEPRTWGACVGVAMLSLLFSGLLILAVAIEGLICLAMAAPLAAPIAILGATVGYYLQLARWNRVFASTRVYTAGWLALPLALAGEAGTPRVLPLVAVTTSVEIAAPPPIVWQHVVSFSDLPPPQEAVFQTGIAYPVRATITGHGVGAVRRCEFSTGAFIEPITVWDEARHLAFDVTEQPQPMRELSPYRSLHPPHLDGFFRSRRGEFRLTALPDGRTRLDGTTWYTQDLWPGHYWRNWSDYLVHTIHHRVLEHIRADAESAARTH